MRRFGVPPPSPSAPTATLVAVVGDFIPMRRVVPTITEGAIQHDVENQQPSAARQSASAHVGNARFAQEDISDIDEFSDHHADTIAVPAPKSKSHPKPPPAIPPFLTEIPALTSPQALQAYLDVQILNTGISASEDERDENDASFTMPASRLIPVKSSHASAWLVTSPLLSCP